ncbi:MAG TPA: TonB-dependent receptor [Pelobium sp.]|nr:TonB-dependent receptor [Pelobium sp.]
MSNYLQTKWKFFFLVYVGLTLSIGVFAQQHNVKGKVVDITTNETIIGASIKVKGSNIGTQTDVNGNFTLNVPDGGLLLVSYLGYKPVEIPAKFNSPMVINLQVDDKQLSEVVVVGYGTQKKETLTGSVAKVDAKAFEDKGSLASPLQALQGQVPGVIITRGSSAPGDESWSLKLRGAVSATSTEPLVIIDGVAASSFRELRLINPSDIDNISFLKDAAAAIYGSRAAGGVVLVTTKKAKLGKAVIAYNGSYTRKFVGLQPHLMSLDQWANGVIEARTNDGFGADDVWIRYANLALANKGGYIDARDITNQPVKGAFNDVKDFVFLNNNWSDVLWGGANSQQHDISVSGRNEKSGYRLSLGYTNDDGILKYGNNTNKRYNIRLNNDFKVFDKVSVESVIAYNRQDQVAPSLLGNIANGGYPQPGLPTQTLTGKPYAWGGQYTPTAFGTYGGDNRLNVSAINISETFKYQIYKDLQFVTNLGYNNSIATRDLQKNSIEWYNYEGDILVQTNPSQANSSYQKTFAKTDFYSATAYLNYNKTLAKNHNFGATLGTQYERNEYDSNGTTILDINSSLSTINGNGLVTPSYQKDHYALGSYFGRFNYNYKSKYLLEANARYDGSSKFLADNRWNFFYGFSGGWRLSEEDIVRDLNVFNELKLRASYGIVGNQSGIDLYDGQQLYNSVLGGGAYLGGGKVNYVTTNGRLVSFDRTWEKIHNYNVALDFSLLNNRLSGTAEWFIKKNNNMFLNQAYPTLLGANAPTANIGKFESKGWEGILNWNDKTGDWAYNIGGSVTYAKNNLIDFGGKNVTAQGFNGAVESYPLNSIFGLKYAGRIQTQEQAQAYLNKYNVGNGIGLNSKIGVGDNKYEDVNGDGVLDTKDLVYLGTDDPQLSYSVNAGASYKGFDFSVIFQGAGERTTFREDLNWRQPFRSVYLNTTNQSVGDHWTPQTTDGHFPRYSTDGSVNAYNYQASSWSAENGAYLRLKNVVLGYTLPQALVDKTKAFSKLRVYVSGQDLWEISHINDGWDPEATRTVSTYQRYPFNRFFTAGINATF